MKDVILRSAALELLEALTKQDKVQVYFRDDWNSFTQALLSLKIGDWLVWDAEEFKHRTWHALAKHHQVKIMCRKHKSLSVVVILRVK